MCRDEHGVICLCECTCSLRLQLVSTTCRFTVSLSSRYITPCYASPIIVGGLSTADPFDAKVQAWWSGIAKTLNSTWPVGAFAGFLIKADCEGEPGPSTYGRTELDGANAMADALAPFNALTIWRAFSHPPRGEDQALYQFNLFKDWNGNTRENVVLQVI